MHTYIQDSVRVLTVPVLVSLAGAVSAAEARTLLLPHAKALANDKSWRVRYMAAEQTVDVCATERERERACVSACVRDRCAYVCM
jgi:hypothetical protein